MRNEVIDNYEKRRTKPDVGALCEGDLDLLKRWNWNQNTTEQYEEYLTVQVRIFSKILKLEKMFRNKCILFL